MVPHNQIEPLSAFRHSPTFTIPTSECNLTCLRTLSEQSSSISRVFSLLWSSNFEPSQSVYCIGTGYLFCLSSQPKSIRISFITVRFSLEGQKKASSVKHLSFDQMFDFPSTLGQRSLTTSQLRLRPCVTFRVF